ncbi:MAG: ABC transporter permease [Acidobacteriota bacterium]
MSDLGKDLRFAVRMLGKNPLVTAAAVVSLAIGIGANTAIFSLINAVLLRSLPVDDPAGLVAIYTTDDVQRNGQFMPISRPNAADIRDGTASVFSEVATFSFGGVGLSAADGDPTPAGMQLVSSNYFETLGVEPALGRFFTDRGRDDEFGSEPYAVISHRFFTERFGADPSIVGASVRLNRQSVDIIGVAPPGFNGTLVLGNTDLWVPASMRSALLTGFMAEVIDDRRALVSFAVARLRDGASLEQATAKLEGLGVGLREQHPVDNKDRGFTALPIAVAAVGPNQMALYERMGLLLLTVVGLVLLIACGNVANLLLGRAAARRREIAVRLAMGASRGRLVRQLLCESLVLAGVAGTLGLVFAVWARQGLWALRPPFLDRSNLDLSFDPRVLGFTALVAVGTGVLFGLAPAIRGTRLDLVDGLTRPSDSADGLGRLFSFRNLLLIGQVALSAVALVGSGLFLRSLEEALEVDLGYRPEQLVSVDLNLGQAGYDAGRGELFFDQVLERARRLPGVKSASLTTIMPLSGGGFWRTVIVEGRGEGDENNRILVPVNSTDTDVLETLGVQLVAGRDFTDADRGEGLPVAMVNRAMAETFWPGADPIGERFHFIGQDVVREVVGVVADSKHRAVGEEPQPQVYVPRRQNYQPLMTLAMRTAGEPTATLGALRGEIRNLDGELPMLNEQSGDALVRQGLWPARMSAVLLGVLGGVALVLASIGIYGVMAYTVSQRDREIAIRMALGADRSSVLRLVLRQGLAVVATGLVLGLGVAAFAARGLGDLIYGVSPSDPLILGGTAAVLVSVALLALWAPAHRATAVKPSRGLRFER